jgi:hypothetical protein
VIAGGESKDESGLALRVERRASQLAALVAEDDGAGGGKTIFAGNGDGDGSSCASALVARLQCQGGQRGQALRALGGERHHGHG